MSGLRIALALAALGALLAALLLQVLVARLRKRTGFSGAGSSESAVVASDTGVVDPILLRDPVLGIRGKPDYLVRTRLDGHQRLVPLELKPARRSLRLQDSDRLQLGAYLLALRSTKGVLAAPFGIVRYAATSFQVALTPGLEADVRRAVLAMRAGRSSSGVRRSHNSVARCRSCAMRLSCDQALAR